jgi:hypothetical protein
MASSFVAIELWLNTGVGASSYQSFRSMPAACQSRHPMNADYSGKEAREQSKARPYPT